MTKLTRRRFLAGTAAAGAATALAPHCRALGSNGDIRVAVIGFRGKGNQHMKMVSGMKGIRLVAVCDADKSVVDRGVKYCEKKGLKVQGTRDMREIFDRRDVDAIITATPNHWHALTAIWAMQSGKDVYVEKPVSYNPYEGARIVEAARKYKRVCQGGFQNRSDVGLRPAYAWLKEGNIGKIKMIRGLCYRNRKGIGGPLAKPLTPPKNIDYNLWLGPAEDEPIHRPRLHYDWHWDWNTGNGDIGNQGPHELDLINWALGSETVPRTVMSFGGRFGWHDAGETCNMQVAVYDCGVPVVFEVRDMWVEPKKNYSPHYKGIRVGVIITCEGGEFRGGRGGGTVYDLKDPKKKIKRFQGDGGRHHQKNFFEAVRSRKIEDLHAEIAPAALSSDLAHYANACVRAGQQADPKELAEKVKGDKLASEAAGRFGEQLANWNVDYAKEPWSVGPVLRVDPATHRFSGGPDYEKANAYLARAAYRKGFEVPEKV